jgi:hypothetical protein
MSLPCFSVTSEGVPGEPVCGFGGVSHLTSSVPVSAHRPRSSAWTHFHVLAWAIKALDQMRVRTMIKAGITDRQAMWVVSKTSPDLSTE